MRQLFTLGDQPHEIGLTRSADGYLLYAGDDAVPVALDALGGGLFRLACAGDTREVRVSVAGDVVHVHMDGAAYALAYTDPVRRFASATSGAGADVALAPMPGTVVVLEVAPGQAVRQGDTLMVIESMKLETAIKAWRDGTVSLVHVTLGGTFDRGAPLVALAPET